MDTLSSAMVHEILDAVVFATMKHDGQFRENAEGKKTPYVVHPLRVAARIASAFAGSTGMENVVVAAILHDTLEDTDATPVELRARFGEGVARMVGEVTDGESASHEERINNQIAKALHMSMGAKLIKLEDKRDNVRSLVESPPPWSIEKKLRNIEDACRVVTALNLGARANEFWADVRMVKAKLAEAA